MNLRILFFAGVLLSILSIVFPPHYADIHEEELYSRKETKIGTTVIFAPIWAPFWAPHHGTTVYASELERGAFSMTPNISKVKIVEAKRFAFSSWFLWLFAPSIMIALTCAWYYRKATFSIKRAIILSVVLIIVSLFFVPSAPTNLAGTETFDLKPVWSMSGHFFQVLLIEWGIIAIIGISFGARKQND